MFNWLDAVLLIVFALSVGSGMMKGFARIVMGVAASIAGLFFALWFYGLAGSFFEPYVASKGISNFIGFVVILLGLSFLGSLGGRLIQFAAKKAGLGWLDRLLGAGVGFVRALLFAIAFVMILVAFTPKPPAKSVVESRFAPYILDASKLLVAIAPRELRDGFFRSYDEIKARWEKALKEGARAIESQVN